MTFLQMRDEVKRRLAQTGRPVFWSDTEINDALNNGYMELSDASEWFEGHQDIDLLVDRPYYDLWSIIGADFLTPAAAFDYQTNRWLLPTSGRQFDAHDRRWERVTGEPQRMIMQGLRWMGYWPRIQTAVGSIKQYFKAIPPLLCADADEPGFPATYHNAIIDFAMTELWAQDAETGFALAAWAQYLKGETDLVSWVAERASDATMHGYGAIGSVAR